MVLSHSSQVRLRQSLRARNLLGARKWGPQPNRHKELNSVQNYVSLKGIQDVIKEKCIPKLQSEQNPTVCDWSPNTQKL